MCYGLCSALVYYNGPYEIFAKFRCYIAEKNNKYLEELFSCMFCLPVNVGMLLSILSLVFSSALPFTPFTLLMDSEGSLWPLIVLFDGFYTGAIVSIIDSIVEKISPATIEINNKQLLND
jgi:VIT1/CCC1 family predicted Fe2+/Mn2+ transporter